MKHRNKNRTLGRTRNGRTALLRSLAASLIVNGRITTTEAKAKELRPFIERLITKGREEGIHSRRLLVSRLGGREEEARKLSEEIAVRYKDRNGGYTRIIKLPARESDGSKMAMIEFA